MNVCDVASQHWKCTMISWNESSAAQSVVYSCLCCSHSIVAVVIFVFWKDKRILAHMLFMYFLQVTVKLLYFCWRECLKKNENVHFIPQSYWNEFWRWINYTENILSVRSDVISTYSFTSQTMVPAKLPPMFLSKQHISMENFSTLRLEFCFLFAVSSIIDLAAVAHWIHVQSLSPSLSPCWQNFRETSAPLLPPPLTHTPCSISHHTPLLLWLSSAKKSMKKRASLKSFQNVFISFTHAPQTPRSLQGYGADSILQQNRWINKYSLSH